MRRAAKPAQRAAPCANWRSGPICGTCTAGGAHFVYHWQWQRNSAPTFPIASNKMTLSLVFWLIAPALVLIAVIDLATMSTERRARFLRSSGLSQVAIAERLGVSRYRIRQALA